MKDSLIGLKQLLNKRLNIFQMFQLSEIDLFIAVQCELILRNFEIIFESWEIVITFQVLQQLLIFCVESFGKPNLSKRTILLHISSSYWVFI